ncbi:peptide/nickel transport system ATP-binding protein [Tessaracoccus bendigoensis DSM 12906]|uniref:Peptide/nickel transport system ATP-binding protein n=1 Tax=Tessaracoccus bendigoensis DSM 12906 TaxID=1123357 RepID=A0A1M6FWW3_9ACTN|nr:ABC transporter ATP-binding protein [Tessaracoccus bendigoensis]SHJ02215.1 peptide/nickel transport system ATP-binding protein [Tessaracoccus bendigoensis DSM 12906]
MTIEVEDLTITVAGSGKRVVDAISFSLDPGERIGIIGESGSGKSVTTLALLGLLPRSLTASGSIRVDGTQIIGASKKQLLEIRGRRMAKIFQDPSTALDPLTRVGELIAEPLRRHQGLRGHELNAAVERALAEVALPDTERLSRAFPHEISGGQRQRVAIAMALACRPAMLIADEPTTALDVTVQAEILDLIRRLCVDHGMGLVFVSHDIAVVSQTVSRALVMQGGQIVERGPIDQIVHAPTDLYTLRLVGSARALDEALTTGRVS